MTYFKLISGQLNPIIFQNEYHHRVQKSQTLKNIGQAIWSDDFDLFRPTLLDIVGGTADPKALSGETGLVPV